MTKCLRAFFLIPDNNKSINLERKVATECSPRNSVSLHACLSMLSLPVKVIDFYAGQVSRYDGNPATRHQCPICLNTHNSEILKLFLYACHQDQLSLNIRPASKCQMSDFDYQQTDQQVTRPRGYVLNNKPPGVTSFKYDFQLFLNGFI